MSGKEVVRLWLDAGTDLASLEDLEIRIDAHAAEQTATKDAEIERLKMKVKQYQTQLDDRWAGIVGVTNKHVEQTTVLHEKLNEAIEKNETEWECARTWERVAEELAEQITTLRAALTKFADKAHWGSTPRGGQVFVDGDQTNGSKLACAALRHPGRKIGWSYCLCGESFAETLATHEGPPLEHWCQHGTVCARIEGQP